jgi:hypothetical protein
MLRHPALLLGALALLTLGAAPPQHSVQMYVGPSQMLLVDADTVLVLESREWQAASVRHQEKLLRLALRMQYWRNHIPPDMRMVYDELGYPTGRVLLTPVGHTEEHWYYGQLDPPLVFRDGELQNPDLFERYTQP